ncbi:MAG: hypothetical protein HYU62_02810 [Caulobacterales bacterium]|nr:hypothetical protein [Caulobacterales bacterium]
MTAAYTDIVDAARAFEAKGYNHDYHVTDRGLRDVTVGRDLHLGDVQIDARFRFDDGEYGDASNLYAISEATHGTKGLLIDAFDVFGADGPTALASHAPPAQLRQGADDVPMKYGMRKVGRSEFNVDPDRYVLRLDYPDFPECPFGESFSMLGFDTAEQTYVWLATAILRDDRLVRTPYRSAEIADNN